MARVLTLLPFLFGVIHAEGIRSDLYDKLEKFSNNNLGFLKSLKEFNLLQDNKIICISDFGKFEHLDDCHKYIKCLDGIGTIEKCPKGQVFYEETGCIDGDVCPRHVLRAPSDDFQSYKENICELSPERGSCGGSFKRYFYDYTSKSCKTFTYGGCGGNGNRFFDEDSCKRACLYKPENKCDLPPEKGPCSQNFLMYYFDRETESCKTFIYGGRRGNDNRFKDRETCERSCLPQSTTTEMPSSTDTDAPVEVTPTMNSASRSFIPMCSSDGTFPHPSDSKKFIQCQDGVAEEVKCPSGLYFSNLDERCVKARDSDIPKSKKENICELSPERGSCGGSFKRYYYDYTSKSCKTFTYGGCGGNRNRFFDENSCKRACLYKPENKCDLPPEKGPCFLKFERYYFDRESESCKTFIYGGCRGNDNRFKDRETCERTCLPYSTTTEEPATTETSTTDNEATLETTASTMNSISRSVTPICSSNGFLPHPSDCSKFIHCHNGVPYKKNCPSGLHFSGVHERCVLPCDAKCDPNIQCELEENLSKHRRWFICDLPPETGDCKGFFEKYYYEQASKSCKRFIYGGCGGNANRFPDKEACERSCLFSFADTETPLEVREPSMNSASRSLTYVCPGNGLFPHPSDCNRFIQCQDGVADEMRCPSGLHFSQVSERCIYPCDAKCNPDIHCELDRKLCSSARCSECPEDFAKYAHPYDCSLYLECKNGFPRVKSCSTGKYWDKWSERCVSEDKVKCKYNCQQPDGIYVYPPDCEKYIKCKNSVSKVIKCPSGHAFDREELRCVKVHGRECHRNDIIEILKFGETMWE